MSDTAKQPEATPDVQAPVLATVRQRTGVLELNRPKALNSLNPEMLDIIITSLNTWRDDDNIDQVVIYSNHPKAFCAGGDVRLAREELLKGNHQPIDDFFAEEYVMNADLSQYPKPYIALIDGVVMGGGLGISAHGSHRVVTTKAFAAMPEMAIGYFTDVGVAHMAQRMVGTRGVASPAFAKWWGITGYWMYAADMLYTGLATHMVEDIEAVREAIIADGVEAALAQHAITLDEPAPLAEFIDEIETTFAPDTWAEIESALDDASPEFAAKTRELMAVACPTSVVAAAELFHAHEHQDDLHKAMKNEESLGYFMRRRPDFAEGVRAVLVDKTRDAAFDPAGTDQVDVEEIRALLRK